MPENFTRDDLNGPLRAFRRDALFLHRPFPVPTRLDGSGSYLGGLPCLPDGIEWPRNNEGRAMHFLAQIDCASLPRTPDGFPRNGLMLFFALLAEDSYCEDDFHEFCRVLYIDNDHGVVAECDPPTNLEPIAALASNQSSKLRFPNQQPCIVPRWPIEFHPLYTWPAMLPGMDYSDLMDRSYNELLDLVMEEQIIEIIGQSSDAQTPDWPWSSMSAFETDCGPDFPQCWLVMECIARSFLDITDRSEGLGFMASLVQKGERDRALEFVDIAKQHDAWVAPTPGQAKKFNKWINRLLLTRRDEFYEDACDAIEAGMLAVLRKAAPLPKVRKVLPPEYFTKLQASHSPSKGDTNRTPHIHQMFGHRFPGPSDPRDWDSEENVLLLQIYSDDAVPFLFGDMGYLQFVISREDMISGRFDRAFALEDQ